MELKVRSLARFAKVSPALVSGTIAILKKQGAINKGKIDLLHPSARALKILLNIESLTSAKFVPEIRSIFKDCNGIGLYGSWANGTNSKDSDLDFWVKSESESEEKSAKISRFVKQKLGLEASIIILTQKRLKELKEKDFVFYSMLYNCFLLWGEGI
ncbi:MAG: nucleotidyltransferase domain-containing protein [Candidatus ainarchaeum sp.]|nr:nucleotidyltransferase domain-containing protein [Candidatus ainarchaeum sp.]